MNGTNPHVTAKCHALTRAIALPINPDDKTEALEQLNTLAKAAQNPQDGTLKKLANTAVKVIRGAIATLPDTAKLVDACSKLLPLITNLLSL